MQDPTDVDLDWLIERLVELAEARQDAREQHPNENADNEVAS